MLDDVQIIRRALSEAEVAALSVGNDAPDVMADTYLLEPGQSLAIDADDGVLRNDSDRNGNDLTASVATGPAGGGLTLSEDGSFQYTPLPGFYGLDSFTYRADDGVTDETATVDLWVALPADANLDRIVDANDYARTRDSFGAQEAGWIDGDFNLDGRVDVPDYLILKANYGRTYDVGLSEAGGGSDSAAGTDASSPPEPAPPTQTEAPLPAPTDAESQPIPPAVDASPLTAAALDDPPALPADPPAADALTEPTPLEVASAGPSSARVRSRRIDADPPSRQTALRMGTGRSKSRPTPPWTCWPPPTPCRPCWPTRPPCSSRVDRQRAGPPIAPHQLHARGRFLACCGLIPPQAGRRPAVPEHAHRPRVRAGHPRTQH